MKAPYQYCNKHVAYTGWTVLGGAFTPEYPRLDYVAHIQSKTEARLHRDELQNQLEWTLLVCPTPSTN